MIDKKKATALFLEELEVWEKSQQGQTSGYKKLMTALRWPSLVALPCAKTMC